MHKSLFILSKQSGKGILNSPSPTTHTHTHTLAIPLLLFGGVGFSYVYLITLSGIVLAIQMCIDETYVLFVSRETPTSPPPPPTHTHTSTHTHTHTHASYAWVTLSNLVMGMDWSLWLTISYGHAYNYKHELSRKVTLSTWSLKMATPELACLKV